jgi:hypothetical protein
VRVQFANTSNRRWYRESQSISWGFGFDVEHYADLEDTGTETVPVGAGWCATLRLGPWCVSLFDEAGFRAIFGSDVQYYGRFSVSQV